MPTTGRPRPQARGLAAMLRTLRLEARLSMREVARRLEWSQPTLSRIEAGKRPVAPEEVSALLAIYGTTGEQRSRLIDMARDSDRPTWVETRFPGAPLQGLTLMSYEAEADTITYMDLALVTGMFQTVAYMRAVMLGLGVRPSEIGPRVELRLERQKLLERAGPPRIISFMDESTLRRVIGGPDVMAAQLRHLADLAQRPHIDLRIVPFDRGAYAGLVGSHTLLEFSTPPPVVHAEIVNGTVFLDRQTDVGRYVDIAAALDASALSAEQSLHMLAKAANTYESE